MQKLRIRPKNATVRELNPSPEVLEELNNQMEARKYFTSHSRSQIIKHYLGTSSCCVCGDIPSVEISYKIKDKEISVTMIEAYCERHARSLYEKTTEPSDSNYYGCTPVPSEDHARSPGRYDQV